MEALAALVPSIGVGFLFYLAIRAIMNADRRERAAMAELDLAERQRAAEAAATGGSQVSARESRVAEGAAENTSVEHRAQSPGDNSTSSS